MALRQVATTDDWAAPAPARKDWKIGQIIGFIGGAGLVGPRMSDCWLVLRVRSGSEIEIAERLQRRGHVAYVPMARLIRRRQKGQAIKAETIYRPAFVGYVFWGLIGAMDWDALRIIPGILGPFISGVDALGSVKMVVLPTSEIVRIGQENDRKRFDTTRLEPKKVQVFQAGDRVVIEVVGMQMIGTVMAGRHAKGDVKVEVTDVAPTRAQRGLGQSGLPMGSMIVMAALDSVQPFEQCCESGDGVQCRPEGPGQSPGSG